MSPEAPEQPPAAAAAESQDEHTATLALRKRLAGAHPFRDRGVLWLAIAGLAGLAILAVAPLLRHGLSDVTTRIATIAALTFMVAAPGYWLGLGHRSLAIAAGIVVFLYGATALAFIGSRAFEDLRVSATVLAFLVFGLAGFNLVFVLEEMIYDAHRLLPHRRRGLLVLPLLADAALCIALPLWSSHGGLSLPALWVAAMATTLMLASWWFIRVVNDIDRRQLVIRELHLFVAGILGASLLADAVHYIVDAEDLVPSIIAYVALLATWVYVSYTTLQRTHLLLRGRNAAPWVAILLAATYAIVAHGQGLFLESGTGAVQTLFSQRMAFMIAGVWIGVAFYAARGIWRTAKLVTQLRTIPPRGRAVALQAVRVAQGVLATQQVVGHATRRIYLGLDRALPGSHDVIEPAHPRAGWELDDGRLRAVDDEE